MSTKGLAVRLVLACYNQGFSIAGPASARKMLADGKVHHSPYMNRRVCAMIWLLSKLSLH